MIKIIKRLWANNWAHSHNYAIKALTGLVVFCSTENRAHPHMKSSLTVGGLIYAGKR
jgi:hypothetical protein